MIGDWDIMQIGIGAGATLCATGVYHAVMAWARPPRVRDAGPGVRALAIQSPHPDSGADPDPMVVESEPADESEAPAEPQAVVPPQRSARQMRAIATVNAPDQIREFVAYMVENGYARPLAGASETQGRYAHDVWWRTYLQWTDDRSIGPLPQNIFLGAFKSHPNVKRWRPRKKSTVDGSVEKLPSGTPVRHTFYTLWDEALVEATVVDPISGRRRAVEVAAGNVRIPVKPVHQRRAA
jgi:hypothetical protein